MRGWIGVDLDGTLAEYHGWQPDGSIGKPVALMLQWVKQWLEQGIEVRIVTARVGRHPTNPDHLQFIQEQRALIQEYCKEHLGVVLPITYEKGFGIVGEITWL